MKIIAMIGTTISHYKILEKIGGGGMGVVYKAQDTKLKRTVALKFLPPDLTREDEAKARFVHEAQAASALQHSNICTVHDIDETPDGQMFIVMDLYDGETLKKKIERGPLPIDEAIDIAIQVARGLTKAHEAMMVHRDIKPANIMVTKDGEAKIVDFGLAKLAGRTLLTKSGSTVGTAAYMSPEQARGEEVDTRTDIWSLGVLIFEMVTGERPFKGEYDNALIYSILNVQPTPMTTMRTAVPMELGRIASKALAKDKATRYQSATDLLVDLRSIRKQSRAGPEIPPARPSDNKRRPVPWKWIAPATVIIVVAIVFLFFNPFASPGHPIRSIAVLPLSNFSHDPEQEYFVDGMTEALIAELSKIHSLTVISRTSIMQFKDTKKTLPEIAQMLGVDALIEGSALLIEGRVRITAQLFNASEKELWGDQFTRRLENILTLQSEVAQSIAKEVRAVLTPGEQAALHRTRTVNTEAYQEYLKGRFLWLKRNRRDLQKAVEYFTKAVKLDTTFAPPYSGLADAYLMMANYGGMAPSEAYEKARTAAMKSLELDRDFAEAHASLGYLHLVADWRWSDAEARFKRAIELNPNYANAYNWYAVFLAGIRRHAEALELINRAHELDPFSLIINDDVAWVHYNAGRYDEAIEQYEKTIAMDSSFVPAHEELGRTYVQKKMYNDAVAEFRKVMSLTNSSISSHLAYCYAVSGNNDEARSMLSKIFTAAKKEYVSPYEVAVVFCGLGETEQAFSWLEKALIERSAVLLWFKADPAVNPLRSDHRFASLLKRMGLEE